MYTFRAIASLASVATQGVVMQSLLSIKSLRWTPFRFAKPAVMQCTKPTEYQESAMVIGRVAKPAVMQCTEIGVVLKNILR
jgi:hypothetical protein